MVSKPDPQERITPFVTRDDAGAVVGAGVLFVPLLDALLGKPMVAINELMGFRPRDVMGEFVRTL